MHENHTRKGNMTYKSLFFIVYFILNSPSLFACSHTDFFTTLRQENEIRATSPRLSRSPVMINEKHIPPFILQKIFFDPCIDISQKLRCRLISKSLNSIIVEGLFPSVLNNQKQITVFLSKFIFFSQKMHSTLNFPLITNLSINFESWTKKELSLLKKSLTPQNFPYLITICISDIMTDKNADGLTVYKVRKILDKFKKKSRKCSVYSITKAIVPFYEIASMSFSSKKLTHNDQPDFDITDSRFYKEKDTQSTGCFLITLFCYENPFQNLFPILSLKNLFSFQDS